MRIYCIYIHGNRCSTDGAIGQVGNPPPYQLLPHLGVKKAPRSLDKLLCHQSYDLDHSFTIDIQASNQPDMIASFITVLQSSNLDALGVFYNGHTMI